MPTPSTLAADVATASLAKIAEGARETTAQAMLNKREDEHPGEGWRASAWLTTHNLAELVAKVRARHPPNPSHGPIRRRTRPYLIL